MAISLFGILFSVMTERMKSLNLVRKIGCSKRRVAAIILTEWLFLLISGTVLGIAAGAVLYELILLIQSSFFGLSPLHGYTAEWAVLQVTDKPFISAIICATAKPIFAFIPRATAVSVWQWWTILVCLSIPPTKSLK